MQAEETKMILRYFGGIEAQLDDVNIELAEMMNMKMRETMLMPATAAIQSRALLWTVCRTAARREIVPRRWL